MSATVEFQLWGRVAASLDGTRIDLGSTRQCCVLAMLLMSPGQSVAVHRLVEGVWGTRPPARVHNVLATYASRLRRSLEPIGGVIEVRFISGGYRLACDPDQVDVHRVRLLARHARKQAAAGDDEGADQLYAQALRLCAGVPLAGLPGEWAGRTRRLLESERHAMTLDRIDIELRLGRHESLVPQLSSLLGERPTDARLVESLMTALHRSGRRQEALATYRHARLASVEELGLEPSDRLQRLERAILQDDPALEWVPPEERERGKLPHRPRPAQLPPAMGEFIGRDEALARVISGLDAGPTVITGVPGAGKTALIVRAAQRVRADYPDGQLFANLGATATQPSNPDDVLARFLRTLGVAPAAMPSDPEERCALYRSLLADRRMLVVIDDAVDEAQVRPLLPPGPGCAVLVGSRQRLAGMEAARIIQLGMLDGPEAVRLLGLTGGADRVAAEPVAAMEVCRLCGFLPLAIRVAGARLAALPGWQLASFATELADERRRLDLLRAGDLHVRASFAVSYQRLDAPAQRLLRRLALLQAPDFTAWLAPIILDRNDSEATAALDSLIATNLVEASHVDSAGQFRYRLHDLVRIFARERAEAEEPARARRAVVLRAIRAWLAMAERAAILGPENAFTVLHGDQLCPLPRHASTQQLKRDPLAWLESELANLRGAVEQAAREGSAETAWHLAGSLVDFFDTRGHHIEWQHTHTIALDAAERAGDIMGTAVLTRGLGYLDMAQDRYERALARLELASTLLQTAGIPHGVAECAAGAAVCHRMAGRLNEAARLAQRTYDLSAGYPLGRAHARYEQALVLREQGRLDEAAEHMRDALSEATVGGFPRAQGIILRGLGVVHTKLGDTGRAIHYLERSREALTALGDELGTARVSLQLAEAHLGQGRAGEAASLLDHCIGVFHRQSDQYCLALALYARAKLNNHILQPRQAADDLCAAAQIWHHLGLPLWQARALRDLGDIESSLGYADMAARSWKRALTLVEGMDVPEAHEISARLMVRR